MLSLIEAAILLVKVKISFCDCNEPESMDEVTESEPIIDHSQPVAAPAVEVASGKLGAAYR